MRFWSHVAFLACLLALPIAAWAQSPPAAPDQTGRIETAPGVLLHFERYGSGPQIVLVPGGFLAPEMRALARPDRTLILYDMRNRGRSSRVEDSAQLTVMTDVGDVEALRRHFNAERLSLVGYSYLGLMVALYATQHPDRVERLVQIGPVPRQWDTVFPADQRADLSTLSAEGAAARAAAQAFAEAAGPDTSQEELCRAQRLATAYQLVGNPANHARVPDLCGYANEHPAAFRRHLEAHFGDIQRRDLPRQPFTALSVPVLTIHGTLDRNAPYGSGLEWATTFRDGRLITVEGGAHQVWLDDAGVIGDIDQFLGGAWPARARAFGRD